MLRHFVIYTSAVLHVHGLSLSMKRKPKTDCYVKVLEIEQRSVKLKQKVSKDFQQKLTEMERQNHSLQQHIEELQKQIKFIEETWQRDRELCAKVHSDNDDLISARQLKRGISQICDNCHDKTDAMQTKASF